MGGDVLGATGPGTPIQRVLGLAYEHVQAYTDRCIDALADLGDIRRYLGSITNAHDVAWKLSALHHVTTGLDQLHRRGIAHQDLKPSNVLVFKDGIKKLADLGCASERSNPGPRDHLNVAGDPNYPPLEAYYGYVF